MAPTAGDIAAANVRAERSRRRWTQAELAEKLGWSASKVSALEAGQRRITIDQAIDLCRALEIPLVRLLQDADTADLRTLGL
jgi:transcriptional regulator with XRE-family HTH domain